MNMCLTECNQIALLVADTDLDVPNRYNIACTGARVRCPLARDVLQRGVYRIIYTSRI